MNFFTNSLQLKTTTLINYVHPDNFKTKTKESFIYSLDELQKPRDGVQIAVVYVPPNFKFGDIKKIHGRYYSIFYYDVVLNIQIIQTMQSFEEDILIKLYYKQFGQSNVRYNPTKKMFTVKQRLKDVAIADEATLYSWKFYNVIEDVKLQEELGL